MEKPILDQVEEKSMICVYKIITTIIFFNDQSKNIQYPSYTKYDSILQVSKKAFHIDNQNIEWYLKTTDGNLLDMTSSAPFDGWKELVLYHQEEKKMIKVVVDDDNYKEYEYDPNKDINYYFEKAMTVFLLYFCCYYLGYGIE